MDIFVINLDSRPDRLSHMSKELWNVVWERWVAADGHKMTLASLREGGWYPDLDWTDPLLGRTLTSTEVACFMSHFQCWLKIVERGTPAIIFEDDIKIIKPLELQYYKDVLESHDLLYLGYREMDPSSTVDVDSELLKPAYPYLLSSYALSPAGALKLIDTHIRNKIIPVDEYVPIMIGYTHDHNPDATENMSEHVEAYRKYEKLSAVALRDPSVTQISRSVLGSDIESGKTMSEQVISVLTVASDEDKAKLLFASAERQRIAVSNLGKGVEWRGGTMAGPGGGQKINLVKQALVDYDDENSIVVFVDGYDVIINDDLETIVDRFKDAQCDILFAAEKTCWPDVNLAGMFPDTGTEYKYLNSGVYVGRVGALKKMFVDEIGDAEDDQLYIQKQFLRQNVLGIHAKLDYENYVFQCVAKSGNEVMVKSNGQLLNVATRCCPCILHGNGGAEDKRTFNNIAGALGLTDDSVNFLPTGDSLKVVGPEIIEIDFMTREECQKLIAKAEEVGKWESMYGDKFPGQELRIRELDINLFNKLENHFARQINPVIEKHWWPLQMYGLRDAFIIKYTPDTQKSLACHHDASLVSTITYLNDDYTGGDTYFPRQKFSTGGTEVGKMVLWPGQVTHGHEGREVTSGSKYALVIWTARRPGDINY